MNNKIESLPRVTNKKEEKILAKELRVALRSGNRITKVQIKIKSLIELQ